MAKNNSAAMDLWSQIFERAAADPWATTIDPSHDETEDAAIYRAAMARAGWSEAEIEATEQAREFREASAPVTSPGVNPHVEAAFGQLADDVEAAMDPWQQRPA